MQSITIQNLTNKNAIPLHLGICDSFTSRLRGLMFTNSIPNDGGLFFINSSEDRVNSAIHMFFMNIDLAIIWSDSSGVVVDKVRASRWKTLAAPKSNAKYILETHTDRFEEYNCGDILELLYDKN
jgi:uncharacterized membrane protein (UPF0127 family)